MLFVRGGSPQETNIPSLYCAGLRQRNDMFNKWTCVQWCRTLMALQIPPATHCQFSWINTHSPLGCSWHRVIIWTACRSLGSIRYHPHSFALSFQLPLTLFLTLQLFRRNICFVSFILCLISVLIYDLVEEGSWCFCHPVNLYLV